MTGIPRPTPARFDLLFENFPHGIDPLIQSQQTWFKRTFHTDVRRYLRMLRSGIALKDYDPVGRCGLTAGEIAAYSVRLNHQRRTNRY